MKSFLLVTILCTFTLVIGQDYSEDEDNYNALPDEPETLSEEDIYNPEQPPYGSEYSEENEVSNPELFPYKPDFISEMEEAYNPEPIPVVDRRRRQAIDLIDICNRETCRNRGNGVRALEICGQAFCTCVNGNSYLQGCGQGLVYDTQRRVCNFPYAVAGC